MGDRYPSATWAPWKYLSPSGEPTYFKGSNRPVAAVLHIMAGWAHTGVDWAAAGHYGASWHYTVARDGSVFQHLDHEDGGYQAGIASPPAPTPTWPLWRGPNGGNINNYSIGIEHEGFPGEPFTANQALASVMLCKWLSRQLDFPYDRDHFPPHADIDLVNRANDFNLPAMREEHYAYMFQSEVENLTRDETIALIKEMQDSGALASTTDVLSCVAQIVGVDPVTYTDKAKVAEVRGGIAKLGGKA